MKRNLLLFFLNIFLSLIIAYPLGHFVIGKFIFKYRFFDFIIPTSLADFTDGLLFGFLLLSPIVYGLWGYGKKWFWSLVSIIPIIIFNLWIGAGKAIWFWSAIFFVSGIAIAKLINLTIKKFKHPNPPMIINK